MDDVSLQVEAGEVFGLLGTNDAGKATTDVILFMDQVEGHCVPLQWEAHRPGESRFIEEVADMDEGETRETHLSDVAGTPRRQFFLETLSRSPLAVGYSVTKALAEAFPGKVLLETDAAGLFDIEGYAEAGHCTITKLASPYPKVLTYWTGSDLPPLTMAQSQTMAQPQPSPQGESGLDPRPDAASPEPATSDQIGIAWLQVQWEGADMDVVVMAWPDGHAPTHYWLLADAEVVARGFLETVSRWTMELRGEVLVFENGVWHKDEHLFAAIQGATFDTLILRGRLKEEIREDIHRFFAAQATYEEYGIPWKRGILLVGPPGNGKTLTVKALVNSVPVPCLYVKNFRAQHGVDEISIRTVFERARRMAPCVLVLEDLDAQLTPQNRSFFLNELDGFALNRGILTLATTNHPERLDPAILDRPSRFDRKYPFEVPEHPERRAYLALWNSTLKPALRLSEEGIGVIADQTEGFSFAYLKELGLSAMMAWIAAPEHPAMDEVMAAQVATLREQMVSAPAEPELEAAQMQQMHPVFTPGMRGFVRYGPGRHGR
ncbi:MAG: AAA family ATPase [Ktedonobacterales bacterium]